MRRNKEKDVDIYKKGRNGNWQERKRMKRTRERKRDRK